MNTPTTVSELLSMQLTHILSDSESANLWNLVHIDEIDWFCPEFLDKLGNGARFREDTGEMFMDNQTYAYYKSQGM